MSNIELIVAALAAGASAGVTNTATAAVQDAYTGLKSLLRPWVRGQAREALEADETDEGVWETRLGEELQASGAAADEQVRAAAELLLGLADPARAADFNIRIGANSGVVGGNADRGGHNQVAGGNINTATGKKNHIGDRHITFRSGGGLIGLVALVVVLLSAGGFTAQRVLREPDVKVADMVGTWQQGGKDLVGMKTDPTVLVVTRDGKFKLTGGIDFSSGPPGGRVEIDCRGRVLPSGDHFRLTISSGPCPAYSVKPIDDYAAVEITGPDWVANLSRQE